DGKRTGAAITPPDVVGENTSATADAGGQLGAGTYQYTISYVDQTGIESQQSPFGSAKLVVAVADNGKVTLSNIPVAPAAANVVARRIYRPTANGGAATLTLLATIYDNTAATSTFIDTIGDAPPLTTGANTFTATPATTNNPTDIGQVGLGNYQYRVT